MKQIIRLDEVELARPPLNLGALIEHNLEVDDSVQGLVVPFCRQYSGIPIEAIQLDDISDSYQCKYGEHSLRRSCHD